jgi:hypothetical protein
LRRAQAELDAATAEVKRHDQAVTHLAETVARRRRDVETASAERRVTTMTMAETAAMDPVATAMVRAYQGELLQARSNLDFAVDSHREATANLAAATRERGASSARVRAAAASVAVAHAEQVAIALDTAETSISPAPAWGIACS